MFTLKLTLYSLVSNYTHSLELLNFRNNLIGGSLVK